MTIHKLTAGSGYDYLTRQVAAQDATERGHSGLASYYSARGEAPGVWVGRAAGGLEGLAAGDVVTEEQMRNLFGSGRHPLAEQLREAAAEAGLDAAAADRASWLGNALPGVRQRRLGVPPAGGAASGGRQRPAAACGRRRRHPGGPRPDPHRGRVELFREEFTGTRSTPARSRRPSPSTLDPHERGRRL
jgi:hypothetical protein